MDGKQFMEKVAEVAPEKYDFLVKTAGEIKESPFCEEIVSELDGILKQAAIKWQPIGTMAGRGVRAMGGLGKGVLTTALGGIGLALAGDMYDATRRCLTKTRNYKRMLSANPDLREKPAAQVQAIFATLHRFNPEFSGDPVVAGSFVRNHVDLAGEGAGAVGLDALKSIVDARKGLNESRRLQSPKFPDMPNKDDTELKRMQQLKLYKEIGPKAPPRPVP